MADFRRRLACGLAVLVIGVVSACAGGADAVDQAAGGNFRFISGDGTGKIISVSDRKKAPSFRGKLLDGSDFDSTSLNGKVVVLNFWGSWCAPCRVETPEFEKVYQETKNSGVEFIGINVKDSKQLADAFLQQKHISYRSVFDPNGSVALTFRDYPPNAIPSTIVLDRQQRVAALFLKPLLANELKPIVSQVAGNA